MSFINGTNQLLYIDFGSGFLPIGCLTANSFTENLETFDSTTKENGGWRTSTPTNQGFSIDFEGLQINTLYSGGDFTKISLDLLKVIKRNRVLIDWKIQDTNLTFIDSGQGYVTDLSSDGNIDEFLNFSGTILGYGEPVSTSGLPINEGLESLLETLL